MGLRQSAPIAAAPSPTPVSLPDTWVVRPNMAPLDPMPDRSWALPPIAPYAWRPQYGLRIAAQATPYPHDPPPPEHDVELGRVDLRAWRQAWTTGLSRLLRGVPPELLYAAPDDDHIGAAATRNRGFTRQFRPGTANNYQSVLRAPGDLAPGVGLQLEPPPPMLATY